MKQNAFTTTESENIILNAWLKNVSFQIIPNRNLKIFPENLSYKGETYKFAENLIPYEKIL